MDAAAPGMLAAAKLHARPTHWVYHAWPAQCAATSPRSLLLRPCSWFHAQRWPLSLRLRVPLPEAAARQAVDTSKLAQLAQAAFITGSSLMLDPTLVLLPFYA
jgi:hypothetical protein